MVWPQNPHCPGSAARLRRNRPKKGVARPVQPWPRAGTVRDQAAAAGGATLTHNTLSDTGHRP